ncbi:MAG: hypothetical protein ACJATA_001816 [Sphingobacteriales bacterium]|jgi:hypothetical protein
MLFYFTLQFKRFLRILKDGGINPAIGIVLFTLLFIGLSTYVFFSLSLAKFIYPGIVISLMTLLGEKKRNEFLKILYSPFAYYKLRIVENLLFAFPFILFGVIIWQWIPVFIILLTTPLMVFFSHNLSFSKSIPTPFLKRPFEFISGFRSSLIPIVICYLLGIASLVSQNQNLSLFSLIILVLIPISFFTKPEREIFVWIHNLKPSTFLLKKTRMVIINQILLTLPLIIMLSIGFPNITMGLAIIFIIGLGLSVLSLYGKYAYYPKEINIIQSLAIGISILIPPILIVLIPILYFKSKNRLGLQIL